MKDFKKVIDTSVNTILIGVKVAVLQIQMKKVTDKYRSGHITLEELGTEAKVWNEKIKQIAIDKNTL